MIKRLAFILVLTLLGVTACSDAPGNRASSEMMVASPAKRFMAADQMAAQKTSNPYLALTHSFRIKLPEKFVRERFDAAVALCGQEDFFDCVLVDASLNEDRNYLNANIQLRIRSQGVAPLIDSASADGEIASQNSRAEDLSNAVLDTDKRLEMLRSYQERLRALEGQAAGDIESLIKVSSELARVQSDIEGLDASRNHLQKRLDLDLVNIQLYADSQDNYLAPLNRALEGFVYNVLSGTSSLITVFAVTLPWAAAFLFTLMVLRWAWRRRRHGKAFKS